MKKITIVLSIAAGLLNIATFTMESDKEASQAHIGIGISRGASCRYPNGFYVDTDLEESHIIPGDAPQPTQDSIKQELIISAIRHGILSPLALPPSKETAQGDLHLFVSEENGVCNSAPNQDVPESIHDLHENFHESTLYRTQLAAAITAAIQSSPATNTKMPKIEDVD